MKNILNLLSFLLPLAFVKFNLADENSQFSFFEVAKEKKETKPKKANYNPPTVEFKDGKILISVDATKPPQKEVFKTGKNGQNESTYYYLTKTERFQPVEVDINGVTVKMKLDIYR